MTSSRRLWAAIAIPPVLWGAQGLLGWYLASRACPGISLITARWIVSSATAAAIAASVWGLRTASRKYEEEKLHHLSMAGVIVGGALTLGLVFAGLPMLMLASCGVAR
jgi:hypothetical protein